MTTQDWAGFILTVLSIMTIVGVAVRWIIKTYITQNVTLILKELSNELKPNGGGSIKDQVTRLEERANEADVLRRNMDEKLDKVYYLLIDHIAEMNKRKSKSKSV
jgi:flagellin-specific chaperone FliS